MYNWQEYIRVKPSRSNIYLVWEQDAAWPTLANWCKEDGFTDVDDDEPLDDYVTHWTEMKDPKGKLVQA